MSFPNIGRRHGWTVVAGLGSGVRRMAARRAACGGHLPVHAGDILLAGSSGMGAGRVWDKLEGGLPMHSLADLPMRE